MTTAVAEATKRRKVVYHVGDCVTVIEPRTFVRVGYPLTLESARAHVTGNHGKEVNDFLSRFEPDLDITQDYKLFYDVVDAIARHHMRVMRFGGKERSIYTELDESLRNSNGWTVISKRVVKTGTYTPGFPDYDGDYCAPYLANEKSHVLLSLVSNRGLVEIEAANVRQGDIKEPSAVATTSGVLT